MVADPVECLLLEVLSLVPCLEAVHEREYYHHRNPTNTAGLEQRGGRGRGEGERGTHHMILCKTTH